MMRSKKEKARFQVHGQTSGMCTDMEMDVSVAMLPSHLRQEVSMEIRKVLKPTAGLFGTREKVHDLAYEQHLILSVKEVSTESQDRIKMIETVTNVMNIAMGKVVAKMYSRYKGKLKPVPKYIPENDVGRYWLKCINWAIWDDKRDIRVMKEIMRHIDEDIENAMSVYRDVLTNKEDHKAHSQVHKCEVARGLLFDITKAKYVREHWNRDLDALLEMEKEAENDQIELARLKRQVNKNEAEIASGKIEQAGDRMVYINKKMEEKGAEMDGLEKEAGRGEKRVRAEEEGYYDECEKEIEGMRVRHEETLAKEAACKREYEKVKKELENAKRHMKKDAQQLAKKLEEQDRGIDACVGEMAKCGALMDGNAREIKDLMVEIALNEAQAKELEDEKTMEQMCAEEVRMIEDADLGHVHKEYCKSMIEGVDFWA